jgi:hypothetical protein
LGEHPPSPRKNKKKEGENLPRERQNQIKFYLDDKELQELKKNIYKSNLSQSDYLRKVVLNKKIIVIDELKDMYLELKG